MGGVQVVISSNDFATTTDKTEWQIATSACVGCEVWSGRLLGTHSWSHSSVIEAVGKKEKRQLDSN